MKKEKCQVIRIDIDDIGYRVNLFNASNGEEYMVLVTKEEGESMVVGDYVLFALELGDWVRIV